MLQLLPVAGYVGLQAALLFGSAGRFDWPMAWLCLAVHTAFAVTITLGGDRRMLNTRRQRESAAKSWDVVLASTAALLFGLVPLIVAGLDFGRFHWSPPISLWLQVPAFCAFAAGMGLGAWAMVTNKFFAKYVQIQTAEGHYAVGRGPYAVVRHPGYLSAGLAFGAIPIALGSLWAIVPAALGIGLLLVRTYLEDETLKAELPGYRAYADRTRWRLLPGIW